MPRPKTNRGKPKTISCPRCGKKFCSKTNVLQHINQPLGTCGLTWHGEAAHALHQVHNTTTMAQLLDDPLPPPSPPRNAHNVFLDSDEGSSDVPVDMDIEMTIQDELQVNQGPSGTFMETFEGCSTAFPGSKISMPLSNEKTSTSHLHLEKNGNSLHGFFSCVSACPPSILCFP
ncbi:hypothetical protein JVT61DRAFT_14845 [Boletus reticuloceps]|uniref:C2H2-type domain-containing protein n=1 Tax=Boletus reticuloceps TaxID=495285 RepID=A0A8I2YCP7_9AGAM|nr:hypothetical protein JVT61DRAFT_14845 [Boletus reticuloceps]